MPRVTVLLPVVRPPALLPFAIETVLAQTVTDFELMVICDGAPEETVACAMSYGARDPRVRTFAHPKGERHGEAYRHAALTQASGELVAHICDDDLWFPNHLEEVQALLAEVDFGHVIHTAVRRDGSVAPLAGNLADPAVRTRFLNEYYNRFGPTFCAYRLSAYRSLAEGWAPAPQTIATDLHMWRKFMRRDDLTFATRAVVSAIHFPAPERESMSLAERAAENRRWHKLIQDPNMRARIAEQAMGALIAQGVENEQRAAAAKTAHAELQVSSRLGLEQAAASRAEFEASARAEIARASQALTAMHADLDRANEALSVLRASLRDAEASHRKAETALREDLARSHAVGAALSEELARARTELAGMNPEHERVAGDLNGLLRSKSWRLTAPLRAIMKLLARG